MTPEEREQFAEHLLDSALRQYSAAEPRPGLESRILANLGRRPFAVAQFAWAAAAAALLAVVFGIWQHNRPAAEVPHAPGPPPFITQLPVAPAAPRATPLASAPARKHRVAAAGPTKLAPPQRPEFPSPAPLSEQETLMLAYLHQTPRDEVLVVIARHLAEANEVVRRFDAGTAPDPSSSLQSQSEDAR
jgi:hypothetical protein